MKAWGLEIIKEKKGRKREKKKKQQRRDGKGRGVVFFCGVVD